MSLLKALRDLVEENMECKDINPYVDQEVSEFISELQDKKRMRRLKLMLKELDKFIDDFSNYDKLQKEQYNYDETHKRIVEQVMAGTTNADQ